MILKGENRSTRKKKPVPATIFPSRKQGSQQITN